jgi:hypothetical protein
MEANISVAAIERGLGMTHPLRQHLLLGTVEKSHTRQKALIELLVLGTQEGNNHLQQYRVDLKLQWAHLRALELFQGKRAP